MPEGKLIIQLPLSASTDFDTLLYVEESLSRILAGDNLALVDGHHIGDEKFSIFVIPKKPIESVVDQILSFILGKNGFGDVLIAWQAGSDGRAVVLWPKGYDGEFRA